MGCRRSRGIYRHLTMEDNPSNGWETELAPGTAGVHHEGFHPHCGRKHLMMDTGLRRYDAGVVRQCLSTS